MRLPSVALLRDHDDEAFLFPADDPQGEDFADGLLRQQGQQVVDACETSPARADQNVSLLQAAARTGTLLGNFHHEDTPALFELVRPNEAFRQLDRLTDDTDVGAPHAALLNELARDELGRV